MYIYVYMYVNKHTYICIYLCVYIEHLIDALGASIFTYKYLYIYVYTCICIYIYMYLYISNMCLRRWMEVCLAALAFLRIQRLPQPTHLMQQYSYVYVPWLVHMCHDFYSYVTWLIRLCHDSFICDTTHSYVPWLIRCAALRIYIGYVAFIFAMLQRLHSHGPWLIDMCHSLLTRRSTFTFSTCVYMCHDSFMYAMNHWRVPWLIGMYDRTCWYVPQDSFICETHSQRDSFICAMTHVTDSFICALTPRYLPCVSRWMSHGTQWVMAHNESFICALTPRYLPCVPWLIVCHDSLCAVTHCVPWLIHHTCAMTHSYVAETTLLMQHVSFICVTWFVDMCHDTFILPQPTYLKYASLTHMDESCQTYGYFMSHIWTSNVTHLDTSRHTHIWMCHVTHVDQSCHMYESFMSLVWISRVTPMYESRHTYEWVTSWQLKESYDASMSHVTPMYESCHTYEWVMSHIWISKSHMTPQWVMLHDGT